MAASRVLLSCLLTAVLVLAGCLHAVDSPTDPPPDDPPPPAEGDLNFANWMHPNGAGDKFAMFNETEQWDETLAGIDGYGFFIGEIASVRNDLTTLVEVLEANDIDIIVEGGGTLNFGGCNDQNGENSAAIELNKIQRVYDAGGEVDYYTMDGPISRVIEGGRNNDCGFTLNQSIEELVDYMQTMHAVYPELSLIHI